MRQCKIIGEHFRRGNARVSDIADDELSEADVGRSPAAASPNSGAGFARTVGGDGGQGAILLHR